MSDSEGRRWGAPSIAGALAAVLVVIGVTLIGVAIAREDPAPPGPRGSVQAPQSAQEGRAQRTDRAPATADAPELDYSAPVRIRIPTIDVDSVLVDLGLDADGVMETPEPVEQAGWFTPSPPPGVPGATVITGHVTWNQEPTVFFELGSLRPGDGVEVVREDGRTAVFEVTRIASFPKDQFPTAQVYNQPARSELRLITCGGEYDTATSSYPDNVVVWATIVDVGRAST